MTLETFFEKFDQLADAPDAVEKMRELVLELAIQGKLVAQASDDEPACKQLERIAAKKSKTGRVARVKAGAGGSCAPEDTETHVPDGWEKTSLAALVTVLNGRAYSKDELLTAGTPVLRVGNLFTSKHWYYSDLELEPDKYCDKGDLIFAWSASFGPFIWPGPKVIYHYHIWKLELHSEADLHKGYLYWFLQNKTQEIKRAGHGVSMLHMTKEKMEKLEVMLPPLAEQKRIVAKVDELMALCDRLEAQHQERETRHAALARASLARFADAPTPANLRKAILTLAVDGSLVKASSKETQFGDGVDLLGGYAFKSEWFTKSSGVRLVRNQNISHGELDWRETEYLPDDRAHEFKKWALRPGDLVLSLNRPFISTGLKLAWITKADCPCLLVQRIVCLRPDPERLLAKYLYLWCNAPHFYRDAHVVPSSGVPYIAPNRVAQMTMQLPPLAEQRRIVVKVEHLMALVDALETQLTSSRATAANLMEAVVAELTTQD
jgi:type I restriction enzyme S subunit